MFSEPESLWGVLLGGILVLIGLLGGTLAFAVIAAAVHLFN